MSQTVIRGTQILNNTVQRQDLDTSTVGQAVVTKIVQGSGITLSSTGADSGTGDVTVSAAVPIADNTQSGLLRQVSGNTTDFVDGTNNSQPLQPVIWSVRLRSFNAIGNPTFEVAQRNIGALLTNPAGGVFVEDRWVTSKSGTPNVDYQRLSTPTTAGSAITLPGTSFPITTSLIRLTNKAVVASLAATDSAGLITTIEGIRFRELSSDVHSISLLVRSSIANQKFGIAIRDGGGTRSLTKLCTLGAANTFTVISLPNLPVYPSAGSFSTASGAIGYTLNIMLAVGSTLTAGVNDTWQNANVIGALGQDNWCSQAIGSTFDVAFIQHEPGPLCTTPIDCGFTQNYDDCLRYFCKSYDYATAIGTVSSAGILQVLKGSGSYFDCYTPFPKPMAKIPTVTIYNYTNGAANSFTGNAGAMTVSSVGNISTRSFSQLTPSAIGTNVEAYGHFVGDAGW